MTEAPCRRNCDIISNLPDDVTDVILMCLPLQDAIRTSILSRKWRYRWAKVPKLTLDHTLWEYISTRKVRTRLTCRILYHLFSLRQGPINECRISSIPEPIHFHEIDKLIFFVSRNELEQLVLELPKGEKYKLPSSVFTCSKMRHLTLHYCVVNPPPTFQTFSKLIRLQLLNVAISDKSLENLISRCPMLEDMELDIADPLNYIEINAPKLRSLNFGSKLNSIRFKNTPLLTDVSIIVANEVNHDSVNRGTCNLVEFFGSLPSLKNLCLGHSIIKAINKEGGDDLPALKLLESQYDSGIKLNRLTKVRLIDVKGTKVEMEFIKLLLTTSPMLEKMMIYPYYIEPESPQTLVEILKEVNKFQRASCRARVFF
ncbi:hypothetical protein KY285_019178 [Solanum tuberosum]|nr:hypothetical protein KY285_019178 [Solanum tuberosum]